MMYLSKNSGECSPLQSKVFSRWISSQLKSYTHNKFEDITKDLSNGVVLIELAEVLTHEKAPKNWAQSPKIDTEKVQNCDIALDMFQKDGIKLAGISGKDITDNNQKLINGLIWTLILHYSIANSVSINTQNENIKLTSSKNNSKSNIVVNEKTQNEKNIFERQGNELLSWALNKIQNYSNIQSFQPYDLALCALLDSYCPEKIHFKSLNPQDSENNLKLANDVMNQLGIQIFVYQEDISQNNNKVDKLSLLTQLAAIKSVIDKDGQKTVKANIDEKESESEWDPETESQTELISEAEAKLEKKEISEEAKVVQEQDEKRKALGDARRKHRQERRLRKQLVLLKAREEAKLRAEVARMRSNANDSETKEKDKDIFTNKTNEIPSKNEINSNDDKNNDDQISKEIAKNNQETEAKDNESSEASKQNGSDYVTTKRLIRIRVTINQKGGDINSLVDQIKKINLGVNINENDAQLANKIERGDAVISIPKDIDGREIAKNLNISVNKDGKTINSNAPAVLTNDNGETQTYHVKLL